MTGIQTQPMQIPAGTFDLMNCVDEQLTYAFQPIVDIRTRTTRSFEALVRSNSDISPAAIFEAVPEHHLRPFDHQCRVDALQMACHLGITCDLNLNVDPRSFDQSGPAMMAALAKAAADCNMALERIVLEVTEGEMLEDTARFRRLIDQYRGAGLRVAIDDFGAGYSGLNLLADFQPDEIKLDRHLVDGIESNGPRQAIARALIQICGDLGIVLVAEGIESRSTLDWFRNEGVRYFQGYLFARPQRETLPEPSFP